MVFKKTLFGIGLVSLATLSVSCSSKKKNADEPNLESAAGPVVQEMPWGYSGDKSPENWSKISPDFVACDGKSQSPIDLVWKKPLKPAQRLDFSYTASTATLDISPGLNMKISGSNQLLLNGKVYSLERIDIHSPSEHQLSKTPMSMEIQLVHKAIEGDNMAVVSVFAIEGKENPMIGELWAQMATPQSPFPFDPSRLIPPTKTHYRYTGSLTHPPCTEGVEWVVFNTPMELSSEQISLYRSQFSPNNRPLQPLNKRKVQNF